MPSNADRLREMYEAFWHKGDPTAGRDLMHDAIEWHDPTVAGELRGRVDVASFFREWRDAWERFDIDFDVEEITPDFILVVSRFSGRGKTSGLDYASEIGQLWWFEDGLAVKQETFRTPAEAREAARA